MSQKLSTFESLFFYYMRKYPTLFYRDDYESSLFQFSDNFFNCLGHEMTPNSSYFEDLYYHHDVIPKEELTRDELDKYFNNPVVILDKSSFDYEALRNEKPLLSLYLKSEADKIDIKNDLGVDSDRYSFKSPYSSLMSKITFNMIPQEIDMKYGINSLSNEFLASKVDASLAENGILLFQQCLDFLDGPMSFMHSNIIAPINHESVTRSIFQKTPVSFNDWDEIVARFTSQFKDSYQNRSEKDIEMNESFEAFISRIYGQEFTGDVKKFVIKRNLETLRSERRKALALIDKWEKILHLVRK